MFEARCKAFNADPNVRDETHGFIKISPNANEGRIVCVGAPINYDNE